ncbi:MAG: hypothetical protein AAGB19_01125 [Cyanobacteria bacterium P01_F01_bin.3]
MIFLKDFRPIDEADKLPPFSPCIARRDMTFRHQFTTDYHGIKRRNQLTITTWMGTGVGFLNQEPHWESFKAIPPVNSDAWREMICDQPEDQGLTLIYLPNRCRTPFNYVEAGIHFGSVIDGELKAYKHLPRELHSDPRGWVTLPANACDRWLGIRE